MAYLFFPSSHYCYCSHCSPNTSTGPYLSIVQVWINSLFFNSYSSAHSPLDFDLEYVWGHVLFPLWVVLFFIFFTIRSYNPLTLNLEVVFPVSFQHSSVAIWATAAFSPAHSSTPYTGLNKTRDPWASTWFQHLQMGNIVECWQYAFASWWPKHQV